MERVHIFHTNDIHSHFENWPRISSYLKQQKREVESRHETYISFDIGDACDRVHPLTEATDGKANVRLLNEAGYDAVTIGNNEGLGSSRKELNHLYDEANFKVILSNLFDRKSGRRPEWALPFDIIKTGEGHKIGIFGLTANFPTSYAPNGWRVKEPDDIIPEMLEILSPLSDTVILLSHLGIVEDRRIAGLYPMIKIILGAHTHHLLIEGEQVRESLLAAAGRYGEYIGHVELELEGNRLKKAKASVQKTQDILSPEDEQQLIAEYARKGRQLLNEQRVTYVPKNLEANWQEKSELVQIGMEAIQNYAKTDVSILNAGLFMQPLLEGWVTKDELHQVLPHPMRVLRCTLNGENMIRLIYEMEKNREFLRRFSIKGMGFRGQIFGEICYNGISYDQKTGSVRWRGELIDREKNYTFATVDHFLYVPFFPTIEIKGKNEVLFPYFIREVLGQYLSSVYPCPAEV